ncbi:mannose-6-phosphate isomerase-like protein (cupin superfamily) [Breoghania corrubedonensis]|uniref:Mannose-6-phosphate isomerase-like protein (Cupin superfamily) n=1 Tax=Breoghania corrubedonensis TaxID=665038 RepID=A0A2T5VED7_9HYPH|nr:cupin domain-containing protein [Breoghania corrubedonensis]PTW62114.1 mannose-6-phosphate isomerase-like protein (cupin superfamily) [Breoghania corrubedonensis]
MTVSIEEEFARITEHWSPRIIADANGQSVKLAKVKGEFVWHDHAGEDELFFIVKGSLTIRYRDRADAVLKAGDIHVVPRGVEHNPIAEEECWLMLFEPAETRHTGDVDAGLTKSAAEQRAHLQPADD